MKFYRALSKGEPTNHQSQTKEFSAMRCFQAAKSGTGDAMTATRFRPRRKQTPPNGPPNCPSGRDVVHGLYIRAR